MSRGNSDPLDTSPAGSLWRHTLAQIPSLFGRMVYLASLRHSGTGRYRHHGLADRYGDETAHRAMLTSHEETFAAWIGRSLVQQKDDLELYFTDPETDRRAAVATWLRQNPDVLPLTARGSERELFEADFRALVEVLRTMERMERPDTEA